MGPPSSLVFHCSDYCPFAHRAWIALEHTRTPYAYTETNVWGLRLPTTKAFRQRSRSRTLPTLYVEGHSHGLDDSIPVLRLLDQLSGGKLTPSDPYAAYEVNRLIANEISTFVSGFYGVLGGKPSFAPTEEERLQKLHGVARALDAAVGHGLAAAADQPISMADIALFPFVERAHGVRLLAHYRGFVLTNEEYPQLLSWYERMLAEPAVKATMWQHRTKASLATQPYDGDETQTRTEYMTTFYSKYAADKVSEVNAGLVSVRPPAFDEAEWARLGAEETDGDSYAAVPPGGSAEPAAKKTKRA